MFQKQVSVSRKVLGELMLERETMQPELLLLLLAVEVVALAQQMQAVVCHHLMLVSEVLAFHSHWRQLQGERDQQVVWVGARG